MAVPDVNIQPTLGNDPQANTAVLPVTDFTKTIQDANQFRMQLAAQRMKEAALKQAEAMERVKGLDFDAAKVLPEDVPRLSKIRDESIKWLTPERLKAIDAG